MSKISLGLNETKVITVSGGRFYYENGAGKIRVKTIGSSSGEFDLSAGMGFQNAQGMENFFALEITNLASVAQDIEYIISYREVFDNRVSFSEIATDNFLALKARTNSFTAYMKSAWSGNLPANFACVALRNPLGSTRNCWVNKIIIGAPSVGRVLIYTASNMATILANAAVSGVAGGVDTQLGKKIGFGPSNPSQSVTDTFVCNTVGFGGSQFFSGYCPAGGLILDLNEPIKLGAGNGVWVTFFETNIPVAASFEIVEESI